MKQNHRCTREVAEQLGYNIRSVQRWCRQYLLNDDICHTVNSAYQQGTTMTTINQKKSERQKQALMRWIKNNFYLKTRDTANIISEISQLHTYSLSIQEACSLLGIHRSTYYRKLKQKKIIKSSTLNRCNKALSNQTSLLIHYCPIYGTRPFVKGKRKKFSHLTTASGCC